MRVLFLNQFFWPDAAATGQLLADFATHLARLGHDVTVICGPCGYARMLAGESAPPVRIIRTPGLRFARGSIARLLAYISFGLAAAWCALREPRPDVVVTLTTPPFLGAIGALLKSLRKIRHVSWEMDLYPEIAVDLGLMDKNRGITKGVAALANALRRSTDHIIVLGSCMRDRLLNAGVPDTKISVVENWADGTQIAPVPRNRAGKLTVLYSGNLGRAHDTATIQEAMAQLQRDDRFEFVFAGDGDGKRRLQTWCTENTIAIARFLPYRERVSLGEALGVGDIGLVTQREECFGSVVPSKVYGLMAAGRGVLYIGPHQTTPTKIIERFRCGWHIDNGDASGLVNLLQLLAQNPDLVAQAGERARKAFLENYDMPIALERLTAALGLTECGPRNRKLQTRYASPTIR